MPDRLVLSPAGRAVDELIAILRRRGYTVVGPHVRDGAIVLDELLDAGALPVGWTDEQEAGTYRLRRTDRPTLFGYAVGPQSPRRYLVPPRRTLWSAVRVDGSFEIEPSPDATPAYAFLGLRACELAAIGVQDRVLRDGPVPDLGYSQARRQAFFVGVNCSHAVATCFCESMGTGPQVTSGHDLAITELLFDGRHELLIEVGSERGIDVLEELTAAVDHRRPDDDDLDRARRIVTETAVQMTRRMDPIAARDVLIANLDHPRWDDVAERCLSCTNCTLVCPTCFCSAVEDVGSLDGNRASRVQRWDSCFTLGHSELHGAGSVRGDTRARYRQWLTHKLSTWWDQFDVSGCVGCGRCIAWCPAAIDITAEVAAISGGDRP